MKLSTKKKLLFGSGIIIVSILILIIVSFSCIRRVNSLHDDMIQLEHVTIDLYKFHKDESELSSLTLEYLFTKDALSGDSLINNLKQAITEIESQLTIIDNSLILFPAQQLLFKNISANVKNYSKNINTLKPLVSHGKIQEARNFIDNVQNPLYASNDIITLKLVEDLSGISDEFENNNKTLLKTVDYTLLILGLGIVLLSVLLAFSMLNMLKKIAAEIRNGVTVLGTSASEILSTVTEISTGASETATAVSETTTTVEEVRQTVLISNQKAHSLLESSQKAADSVEKGRESINEVTKVSVQINNPL